MLQSIKWQRLLIGFVATLFAAISLSVAIASAQGGPPPDVAEKIAERRVNALANIKEKRETTQAKSEEARKAACERRLNALESTMARRAEQAERHVGVFDKIFERVQGFYDSGQLTDPDYDTLKASVEAAQEKAQEEAAALEELNVEVDCENPDVAATVGAFRDSVSAARDALKEYRAELVKLISSLRAAAAEENAQNSDVETEDDNEEESENEEQEAEE